MRKRRRGTAPENRRATVPKRKAQCRKSLFFPAPDGAGPPRARPPVKIGGHGKAQQQAEQKALFDWRRAPPPRSCSGDICASSGTPARTDSTPSQAVAPAPRQKEQQTHGESWNPFTAEQKQQEGKPSPQQLRPHQTEPAPRAQQQATCSAEEQQRRQKRVFPKRRKRFEQDISMCAPFLRPGNATVCLETQRFPPRFSNRAQPVRRKTELCPGRISRSGFESAAAGGRIRRWRGWPFSAAAPC